MRPASYVRSSPDARITTCFSADEPWQTSHGPLLVTYPWTTTNTTSQQQSVGRHPLSSVGPTAAAHMGGRPCRTGGRHLAQLAQMVPDPFDDLCLLNEGDEPQAHRTADTEDVKPETAAHQTSETIKALLVN